MPLAEASIFVGEGQVPISSLHWTDHNLYWFPKFTAEQWNDLQPMIDSTWNGHTWDEERMKTAIRAVQPKAVFVDASS